jgi:hypothetical protein
MSTEERLKRLGLYHLKDNPEALRKALEEMEQQAAEREKLEKEAQQKKFSKAAKRNSASR